MGALVLVKTEAEEKAELVNDVENETDDVEILLTGHDVGTKGLSTNTLEMLESLS